MSEWYDLEPNFNSLYSQLEKQKEEITKLNSLAESLETKEKAQRKELEEVKRKQNKTLFSVDKRSAEILGFVAAALTAAAVIYQILSGIL